MGAKKKYPYKAYLAEGEEVRVFGEAGGRYIVRRIHTYEDPFDGSDIEEEGREIIVSKVYQTPPAPIIHEEVRALNEQVKTLVARVYEEREKLANLRGQIKEHEEQVGRAGIFKTVVDYLDGKITHVAVHSYGVWQVKTIRDFMAVDDDAGKQEKGVRMLSITAATRSTYYKDKMKDGMEPWQVQLEVSRYSDGSGGETNDFVFCYSEEEAEKVARKRNIEMARIHIKNYDNPSHGMIKILLDAGEEVPDAAIRGAAANLLKKAQADLELHKKRLAEVEQAAAELGAAAEELLSYIDNGEAAG